MSIESSVPHGNITYARVTVYRNPCSTSIIIPLVGITDTTPIRHVTTTSCDTECSITYAFAVIHTPVINNTVHGRIGPVRRISTASRLIGYIAPTPFGISGSLLSPKLRNLRVALGGQLL